MKVLVTGANGQLGLSLQKIAADYPGVEFDFTDVGELDITDQQAVHKYISNRPFTHLVNCAAYTAVDKAEEEPDQAQMLNTMAVELLSRTCAENNTCFIQISTDYVFNGESFRPYKEDDETSAKGVYATSKAAGEQAALENNPKTVIVRTSWLYSEFGHNFLKTVRRLAKERDELTMVSDQIGTPTYATHFARGIMMIILNSENIENKSIFHFSNEGTASWYDFAWEIVRESGFNCKVRPIPTEAYPLPAPRPFYSVMSKAKFAETFGYEIPHWKIGLAECLQCL